MKPTVTAVIIAKNEQSMIANCLDTLHWCDNVLVVDTGSSDSTVQIAQKWGADVLTVSTSSLAQMRNSALSQLKTDWVFYIDADERVTPQLAREILVQLETTSNHAIQMHRQNMMYGKIFEHGGWQHEYVTRIFRVSNFQRWYGDIHESPQFDGEVTTLHSSLIHFTHRNTTDGLKKTISWTPIEAKLLHEASTPPVTVFTLIRKGVMEFLRRALFKKGRKDGMEGWIEAIVQGINRVLVYIQLWELQQSPSLAEKYQAKELEVHDLWKKTKLKDLSPIFDETATADVSSQHIERKEKVQVVTEDLDDIPNLSAKSKGTA